MTRSRTPLAVALGTALALAACTSTPDALHLPAGSALLRWAALAELGSDGAVTRASPLHPWPEGQGLPVFGRTEAESLLLTWTDERLGADLVGSVPTNSGTPPLRAPVGCEQRLPTPSATFAWRPGSEPTPVDPSSRPPPEVTADWLTRRCTPPADLPVRVALGCLDHRCAPAVHPTGACTFELDLSTCAHDPVRGSVDRFGALCLGPEASDAACPVTAYVRPEAPPFVVDRVSLGATFGAFLPEFLGYNGLLLPDLLLQGWAYELALVPNAVVVAVGDGTTDEPCRFGAPRPLTLDTYDPATLARTGSAPAPACFTRFTPRPGRASELLGLFAEDGAWMIGSVAPNGTVLERLPADPRSTDVPGEPRRPVFGQWRVLDVEPLPAARAVAVLFGPSADDGKHGDGGNLVFTYDLATLAPLRRFDLPSGQRWAMAPAGDHLLALLSNDQRALEWLDLDAGSAPPPTHLTRIDGLVHDDSVLDVALDAPTGQLIVTGTRDPLVYAVAPSGAELGRDTCDDLDLDPILSVRWPNDQRLRLVFGVGRDEAGFPAYVARWDTARRQLLPGTFRIGTGATSRAAADDLGRVFLLLPWSGELVRLSGL